MNAASFIARRMGTGSGGVSRYSNTIALCSVAVSIAVMIIALSVSFGFKKDIDERISGFTGDMFLLPPGSSLFENSGYTDAENGIAGKVAAEDFVSGVSPFLYMPGVADFGEEADALLFKGVDSAWSSRFFASSLISGRLPVTDGRGISDDLLVSRYIADKHELSVGDGIRVYFVSEEGAKVRKFTVCGIYDAGISDLDRRFVVADLKMLQRVVGAGFDGVGGYEVNFRDGTDKEYAFASVERILYEVDDEVLPLIPYDASSVFPNIYDWLGLIDFNLAVLLVLMVAVAGFNMVSALLIILFERISMIGILKSLGMGDRGILEIFLRKASSIVWRGIAVGNLISFALMALQYFFRIIKLDPASYFIEYVPVDFDIMSILLLDIGGYAVIMLVLMIPSVFISRISPDISVRMK